MTIHKLDSYERNGYHDSDFYDIYYDAEKDQICTVEVGSTRYGGRTIMDYEPLTDGMKELARRCLERCLYLTYREHERMRVHEPDIVKKGDRVELSAPHRNREKEDVEKECPKCYGTGEWENPYKANDVRECFTCKGTGKTKGTKAKKGGKMVTFAAGLKGKVLWCGTFGQFYQNGYNRPGRHNRQLIVLLDDGRKLNVPLAKVKLDEEMESEAETLAAAKRNSHDYCWRTEP